MNRLASETSPYLRSAASQPVRWVPWGAEVFDRAVREDKPILLDIGVVWCHWCHVMDGESYEDEEVAGFINERFIPVKVDRDERPDVDVRYQKQVSAISGQGGWPLTAFLTPDGKCFYGGTYFAPEDSFGRPGFLTILRQVSDFYSSNKDRVVKAADELREALENSARPPAGAGLISHETVDGAAESITRLCDPLNGGFGNRPKFHHSSALDFLLRARGVSGGEETTALLKKALFAMGRGGVRDHLAGGFHRYSVDEAWRVPHFEKTAGDNAELLKLYARAGSIFREAFFSDTARDVIGFVRERFHDGERGGFYSSQDADTGPGDDGDYFTWSLDEAEECLSEHEFDVIRLLYDIRDKGDMVSDASKCVLRLSKEPGEIAAETGIGKDEVEKLIASARTKMREKRLQGRVPFVDTTMYTNYNGMMISAFAVAGPLVDDWLCVEQAKQAFERFMPGGANVKENGLAHVLGSDDKTAPGMLDDYVQMTVAALDLHEATGDEKFLSAAVDLASAVIDKFRDSGRGGYFDVVATCDPVIGQLRERPYQDTPIAAPVSVAVTAMTRLYHHTGDPKWENEARSALSGVEAGFAENALFFASLMSAMDFHLGNCTEVVITGTGERADALRRAALSVFTPNIVLKKDPGALESRAQVCRHGSCWAPVAEPDELVELLRAI